MPCATGCAVAIGVIALVALAVLMGGALNWSWLVAAGIAPLLITVLPCAAMCDLGLCASRMGGGSCSSKTGTIGDVISQASRPESLSAGAPDPNQLTLGLDDSSTAAEPALAAPAAREATTGTQTPEEEKINA